MNIFVICLLVALGLCFAFIVFQAFMLKFLFDWNNELQRENEELHPPF